MTSIYRTISEYITSTCGRLVARTRTRRGCLTLIDLDRTPNEQSTYCSYTYNTTSGRQPSSEFLVRPYIEWTRTWTCQPACGTGALPNLVMEGNTLPTRVGEIQALGTNGGVG